MSRPIQIKDRVLIKKLGIHGKVSGENLVDHNKARKGDLRVIYEQVIRGEKMKCIGWFHPDELERVLDN